MPGLPRKPNPKLTDMVGTDVTAARKAQWQGWCDDCARVQDAWVELMLRELPQRDG